MARFAVVSLVCLVLPTALAQSVRASDPKSLAFATRAGFNPYCTSTCHFPARRYCTIANFGAAWSTLNLLITHAKGANCSLSKQ